MEAHQNFYEIFIYFNWVIRGNKKIKNIHTFILACQIRGFRYVKLMLTSIINPFCLKTKGLWSVAIEKGFSSLAIKTNLETYQTIFFPQKKDHIGFFNLMTCFSSNDKGMLPTSMTKKYHTGGKISLKSIL